MKYKNGDLLKAFKEGEIDIFVHGCNCFCTMGSGIARQIKSQFPKMYKIDKKTQKGDRDKLGTITFVELLPGKVGINAYTQFTFWDPEDMLSYDAIRSCMNEIIVNFGGKGLKFGIPKIGCGLALGNIYQVVEILDEVFKNEDLTMYVLSMDEIPDDLRNR